MQAVECGEMSPLLSLPTLLPKPDAHLRFDEFVTHRAPFRYRKFYAGKHLATSSCECPRSEACCLISTGRPSIRRSLLSLTLSGLR